MIPVLPFKDPDPNQRQKQLETAREDFQFDFSYHDIAWSKKIPPSQVYSPDCMAKLVENTLEAKYDYAKWAETKGLLDLEKSFLTVFSKLTHGLPTHQSGISGVEVGENAPTERPPSEEAYAEVFQNIKRFPISETYQQDWNFAWQKVAGNVPVLIKRLAALPANFPVSNAQFRLTAGGDDSLEAALSEGRLFLVDYQSMAQCKGGEVYGFKKYIYAPMVLLTRLKSPTTQPFDLVPVAIQCGQIPGKEAPIYTPADGAFWRCAKYAAQVAEADIHSTIVHFAYCHTLSEIFTLATKRSLAENHPLMVLMDHHFEWTLSANDVIRRLFAVIGGSIDVLLAPSLEGTLNLVRESIAVFDLNKHTPPEIFEHRDVADADALPVYPFRDDTMRLWRPLKTMVDAYVALYYTSDADVVKDVEVQAWVRELQARDGGRLQGIGNQGKVETVDQLSRLVAQVIYRVSAFHAAINYMSFPTISFAPNMAYAGFAPVPLPDHPDPEQALAQMMPPWKYAWFQFESLWGQMSLWQNQIGKYPPFQFKDHRVRPIMARFKQALEEAESAINADNTKRPIAYTVQLPTQVTASVQC